MISPPLLLTATINPGFFHNVSTVIKDVDLRRSQYQAALEFYLKESRFTHFVFAENSDEMMDESSLNVLAESLGKHIEFLHCPEEDPDKRSLGKSFGEATLLRKAMEQSEFLKKADSFYKVTGRIIVRNINRCIQDKSENCFVSYNFQEWVLTSFFKCRIEDFRNALDVAVSRLYFEQPYLGPHLEHAYYKLFEEAGTKVKAFPSFPDLDGQIGGAGTSYRKSRLGFFGRVVLNKLGFFSFRTKLGLRDKILQKVNGKLREG